MGLLLKRRPQLSSHSYLEEERELITQGRAGAEMCSKQVPYISNKARRLLNVRLLRQQRYLGTGLHTSMFAVV